MTITASIRNGIILYYATTPAEAAMVATTFGMRHLPHTATTFVTEDYTIALAADPFWEIRPTLNARIRNHATA